MTDLPLIPRDSSAILTYGPAGPVSVAKFLAKAEETAASLFGGLPRSAPIVNLCRDRGHFAIAFAAAALDGRVSLLGSDRSSERLSALASRYPGATAVVDDASTAAAPLRALDLAHMERGRCQRPPGLSPAIAKTRIVAEVFTSGSTGEPVAHAKTWQALACRSAAAAAQFGIGEGGPASIVGTVPAQHMYGFETTILLPFHAAAACWTGPAFFPEDIRTALAAMPEPRFLVTTPLQLRTLLEAGTELPALSAIISASAPLAIELAEAAERRWRTQVLEIFGATEVGSIASRRTVEQTPWQLYPGIALVAGPEGGVRVEAEGSAPEQLQDVVELAGDRCFRLVDRRADLVKIGGRRASLSGLNRLLTAIDGVEDGIFVAPVERDRGPASRMQVFVVAPQRRGPEIMSALRLRVDPAFLPRELVFVDRLPRTEIGKLPRSALAGLQARLGVQD